MVKRGIKMAIFLMIVLVLVIMPLTSAGFFEDFYARITGKAVNATTSLNITIGNTDPTITFVEIIPDQLPNEGGNKSFTFNFTADDVDGAGTINKSSAQGRFVRAGEPTRLNTSCVERDTIGTSVNFTCTIEHPYFDEVGAWTVNVSIRDNNNAYVDNTTTSQTLQQLTAMILSPTALSWPGISVSATDTEANENITINNTGNDVNLNINVTGLDLEGEGVDPSKYIFAENFTVNNVTQGSCTVTGMVNQTSINVTNSILQRGENVLNNLDETSGQEQIVFCLKAVNSDLPAQSYSSAAFGAWVIEIIT